MQHRRLIYRAQVRSVFNGRKALRDLNVIRVIYWRKNQHVARILNESGVRRVRHRQAFINEHVTGRLLSLAPISPTTSRRVNYFRQISAWFFNGYFHFLFHVGDTCVFVASRVLFIRALNINLFLFIHRTNNGKAICQEGSVGHSNFSIAQFLIRDSYRIVIFSRQRLTVSRLTILDHPCRRVAFANKGRYLPFDVHLLVNCKVRLNVIVCFRLSVNSNDRLTIFVRGNSHYFNHQNVVISRISLNMAINCIRSFFQSIMFTRCFHIRRRAAMDQSIRPPRIGCQFQFANSRRVPFAICPDFRPDVIIINVHPAQDVSLAN